MKEKRPTERQALKLYSDRLNEIKGLVKQYGKDAAIIYMLTMTATDTLERTLWLVAISSAS